MPSTFTKSGVKYNFLRRKLNGVNQTDGVKDVSVTMSADATVVAVCQSTQARYYVMRNVSGTPFVTG